MTASPEPNPQGPTTEAQRAVLDSLRRYACLLHLEENYEEAETAFLRVLKLEPENPRFVIELGWTIFKNRKRVDRDRLAQSGPYLEKACHLAPENGHAHYCYAVYHMACGDSTATEHELRQALKWEPRHAVAKQAISRLMAAKMKLAQENPAFLVNRFARSDKEVARAANGQTA